MVIKLKKFIIRIIGLKHIKFTNDGPNLFNFPMFLLPVNFHYELIENISKEIGINKTRQIFHKIGKLQGNFAVKYFKAKFKILPDEEDLSFYLEQITSIGLGTAKFDFISSQKNKIILSSIPISNFTSPDLFDFYFEGVLLGGCEAETNSNLISKTPKKINNKYILTFFQDLNNININLDKINYSYKNIILSNQSISKNFLVENFKKIEKNIFYSNNSGTYFHGKKHFFTLTSVFVLIYYYFILENKKLKKVFFNIFEKFGETVHLNVWKTFNNKNSLEVFNLISIYGFGNIKILLFSKNKFKFEIIASNFERISKKIFKNQYDIVNNDLVIGFTLGIFKSSFKKTNISIKRIKLSSLNLLVEFSW